MQEKYFSLVALIHHEHLSYLLDLITIMDVLPLASTEHAYAVRTTSAVQCNRIPHLHCNTPGTHCAASAGAAVLPEKQ